MSIEIQDNLFIERKNEMTKGVIGAPKDYTTLMEEFSYTHVQALSIAANLSLYPLPKLIDNKGFDKGLMSRTLDNQIWIQVKSEIADKLDYLDIIPYELKEKNYNDLANVNTIFRRFLFVIFLPRDIKDWVIVDNCDTHIRYFGYWYEFTEEARTCNKKTKRINIPINNKLSVEFLVNLFKEMEEGL